MADSLSGLAVVLNRNLMAEAALPLACCFSEPGHQGLGTMTCVASRVEAELRSPGWVTSALDPHDLTNYSQGQNDND